MKYAFALIALLAAPAAAQTSAQCSVPVSPALYRTGLALVGANPAPAINWPQTMVAGVKVEGAPTGATLSSLAQAVGLEIDWGADDATRDKPLAATLGVEGVEMSAEQMVREAAAVAGLRVEAVPGKPGVIRLVPSTAILKAVPSGPALSLMQGDKAAEADVAAMSSAIERGTAVKAIATAKAEAGGLVIDSAFVAVKARSGRLDFSQLGGAGALIGGAVEGAGGMFIIREAHNGSVERWLDQAADWRVLSRQRLAAPYGYRLTADPADCGGSRSPAGVASILEVAQIESERASPGAVRLRARMGFDDPARLGGTAPLTARPGDRLLVLSGDPRGGWQTGLLGVVRVAEAGIVR